MNTILSILKEATGLVWTASLKVGESLTLKSEPVTVFREGRSFSTNDNTAPQVALYGVYKGKTLLNIMGPNVLRNYLSTDMYYGLLWDIMINGYCGHCQEGKPLQDSTDEMCKECQCEDLHFEEQSCTCCSMRGCGDCSSCMDGSCMCEM